MKKKPLKDDYDNSYAQEKTEQKQEDDKLYDYGDK